MKKASSSSIMTFRLVIALILGIFVIVILIRGINEQIYGACWSKAKYGFEELKEGENDIVLGDCIVNAYLVPKDGLDALRAQDVNIFSCAKRDDPEYFSFAIIRPDSDVKVTEIIESGGKKITQSMLETYCVGYKYKLNTMKLNIFEGKKSYCIKLEKVSGSTDPNDKYVSIREGGC